MTDKQFVHTFGFPLDDVGVLGVRGAHLAQLAALDVPVPPGFTVGTAAWHLRRLLDDPQAQVAYEAQLDAAIEQLELDTGSALDDPSRPLIVSVTASGRRAVGPPSTQPIDVGLSDRVVQRLAGRTDREFALVVYDEMIQAFCVRVRGLDPAEVAAATAGASRQASIGSLHALLAARGDGWPERARDQLAEAIDALLHAAPRPTAVVVQARVSASRMVARVWARPPRGSPSPAPGTPPASSGCVTRVGRSTSWLCNVRCPRPAPTSGARSLVSRWSTETCARWGSSSRRVSSGSTPRSLAAAAARRLSGSPSTWWTAA